MGLRHSGPASDAAFFTRCERGWVEDAILHRHGIDMYVRFRDNVWVFDHDRDAFKSWYWESSARCLLQSLCCRMVTVYGVNAIFPSLHQ